MNKIGKWIAMVLGIWAFAPSPVSADVAGYQAMTLSLNPVAYYKLDESSGPVIDSSVNTNNGSAVSLVTRGVAGIVSNAARTFNYGRVAAPDTYVNFDAANGFTLEGWVKTTETNSFGIITHYIGGSSPLGYMLLADSGKLYAQLRDGAVNYVYIRGTATINDGQWHYVAATHAAGGETSFSLQLYVDGQPDAPSSFGDVGTLTSFATNSQPIYLGYLDQTATFDSGVSVDEVAIYNTVLSGAQILTHFQSLTIPISEPGQNRRQ